MRIGVVIPAFNAAAWIADAIASVLVQTHHDWSLVVVDDGSTDGTADVVAGLHDPRIHLIRQANAGVSAARNRGMAMTTRPPLPSREGVGGRVSGLLFLDSDDWLAPDALFRLDAALTAAPHAVAASGPCTFVDTGAVRTPPTGDVLPRLLVRNLFANGGHLLLRAEAVQAAGSFQPNIVYGEDWEFWIRIALQGPLTATQGKAPVLFVRQHTAGAYRRLAQDPGAFAPCMDAIFGNPALLDRFGAQRLAAIRRWSEAENQWVVGREQLRAGSKASGLANMRRSVRGHFTPRRAVLLAAAHLAPLLPALCRGRLRPHTR